ncbi:hypothetical protein ElyMa_006724300 [Elysia marginata]|uniref:Uncharacterized protein n=1 Tax=Elysia marginata TaxID=1093978 RepID=A0AAV4ITL8_9GAST|nr:hypothetical protein ElyMa_006724300 [Elysia marginata]
MFYELAGFGHVGSESQTSSRHTYTVHTHTRNHIHLLGPTRHPKWSPASEKAEMELWETPVVKPSRPGHYRSDGCWFWPQRSQDGRNPDPRKTLYEPYMILNKKKRDRPVSRRWQRQLRQGAL